MIMTLLVSTRKDLPLRPELKISLNGFGEPPPVWVVVLPRTLKTTPLSFVNILQEVMYYLLILNTDLVLTSIMLDQSHGMYATVYLSQTQSTGHQLMVILISLKKCAEDITINTSLMEKQQELKSEPKPQLGLKSPEPKLGNIQSKSELTLMLIKLRFKPRCKPGDLSTLLKSNSISLKSLSLILSKPKMMLPHNSLL